MAVIYKLLPLKSSSNANAMHGKQVLRHAIDLHSLSYTFTALDRGSNNVHVTQMCTDLSIVDVRILLHATRADI